MNLLGFLKRAKVTAAYVVQPILHPPQHKELFVVMPTFEECMREMEREGGLPEGDLSVSDREPEKVGYVPSWIDGIKYCLTSKSHEIWKQEGQGYVYANITEVDGPSLARLPFSPAQIHNSPKAYIGKGHVSRNCPGAFKDNKCENCGYETRALF
jgi:hypothetical protein